LLWPSCIRPPSTLVEKPQLVEADPLDGQGIDLAGGAPEGGLDAVPEGGVAEPSEQEREAVVGEIEVADGQSGGGFKGMVEALDPIADVGLTVIGLREDVGDPEGDEPSVGEPLVEGMGSEELIEDLG
jgi:hypothetical protein